MSITSDDAIVREQYDRYVYMRDNGHLEFMKKAKKCEEFFKGNQWDEATKAKLTAVRRPALTVNKILPSLAVVFAQQLENRADVSFKPVSGADGDTARALDKVWMHIARNNKLDWIESEVFDDAVITSRGFYDVRLCFKTNIMGDVKITHLNPNNVLVDPDSESYDTDGWKDVTITKWLTVDDIKILYGPEVGKELEGRTRSQYHLGYDFIDTRPDTFGGARVRYNIDTESTDRRIRVLERQHKKLTHAEFFVDLTTGDLRRIPDSLSRSKKQAIMQEFDVGIIKQPAEVIWWTVTADDVLCHNAESPFRNFTVVPFFPFFRRGTTIGLVENLIDPQELYNKTRSQELHVINTSANSGWKIKTGTVVNMDMEELEARGAETGLVMEVNDMTGQEKITPNQVPTGLDRMSGIAADDLKEISMASDSLRGFDRADVAAKAIAAKQQVGGKNFAKLLDNLQRTRTLLANRVLSVVQDYYIDERIFTITSTLPSAQSEEIVINQHDPETGMFTNDVTQGKYEVVVVSVPDRDTRDQSQLDEAIRMRELGIAIPDEVIIAHSTLDKKQALIQKMSTEPTPEQLRMQQLEQELKYLEAQKTGAEAEKIQSETALNLVRAQRTAEESAQIGNDPAQLQDMRALRAAELAHESKLAELKLKKYEIDEEMKRKDEELRIKRAEIRNDVVASIVKMAPVDKERKAQ